MPFAAQLREQIEAALAQRGAVRLRLAPRLVSPGWDTGYATLDAVLRGGLPVAGTSEIVGGRSSGRATVAAAYLAERTREGHVCAWVDVAGDMCPLAAMADGADLKRILWVRCTGGAAAPGPAEANAPAMYVVEKKTFGHDKSIGTPGARNRPLSSAERVEQVNSDRQPARRGAQLLQAAEERAVPRKALSAVVARKPFATAKKPWTRLEQAIKAVDLLVQAGGFSAIVLDLGGIAPQYARRIPLATWFRWRAALVRTRSSLVVLSQMGLTGSSAELVLRVEADLPPQGTVLTGIPYRLQVVRRRFAEEPAEVPGDGQRKGPARERASATVWESRGTWVAR